MISLIFLKPVFSFIGTALFLQNLIPLYSGGLWEAVNITAGFFKEPDAKYKPSVLTCPMSIASAPESATPFIKALLNAGEESLMSYPTTTSLHFRKETKALPILYAISSVRFFL